MANRKIIFYLKTAMKPVILTVDENESLDDIDEQIDSVLMDNKIAKFKTASDTLTIRPSEIQAVLVTNKKDIDSSENKETTDGGA